MEVIKLKKTIIQIIWICIIIYIGTLAVDKFGYVEFIPLEFNGHYYAERPELNNEKLQANLKLVLYYERIKYKEDENGMVLVPRWLLDERLGEFTRKAMDDEYIKMRKKNSKNLINY